MHDFETDKKIVKELHVWTWISIILPGLTIFGAIIMWTLGLTSESCMFIVICATIIISFATIWWWWALSIVGNLSRTWNVTQQNIQELILEVQEVKTLITQAQARAGLVHDEKQKRQIGELNA